ncbi:unnamed protein product [Penicillium palitans]
MHVDHPCRRTPLNIHFRSGRGGLRLQDNRQTGNNHFDQQLQSCTSITYVDHPPRSPTSTNPPKHPLPVWPWRASASGQPADCFNHAPRSPTSINPPAKDPQRLTVVGFTASGQSQTGDNHFQYARRSPTSITQFYQSQQRSTSGLTVAGLRASDQSADTGDNHFKIHFDHPLRTPTSTNLTIAGFASGQSADWSTIHPDHSLQTSIRIHTTVHFNQ